MIKVGCLCDFEFFNDCDLRSYLCLYLRRRIDTSFLRYLFQALHSNEKHYSNFLSDNPALGNNYKTEDEINCIRKIASAMFYQYISVGARTYLRYKIYFRRFHYNINGLRITNLRPCQSYKDALKKKILLQKVDICLDRFVYRIFS